MAINTATQLWYVATQLEPMDTRSPGSVLTHVVSKTFAGIGILDMLHNTAAGFFVHQLPSTTVKVLTGLGFAAGSLASDWIVGACLAYDLLALSVGQASYDKSWSTLLGFYAVGSAAIVGAKNFMK